MGQLSKALSALLFKVFNSFFFREFSCCSALHVQLSNNEYSIVPRHASSV